MSVIKNFFKNSKVLPVDKFFKNVLFDKRRGYYSSKIPFGDKGDFLTAPEISNLFSEIIGVWIISAWNTLGKPKIFNFVELGPGTGSLAKVLTQTFRNFPEFDKSVRIFLYEKSDLLKKIQKKNIDSNKVKWIKDFSQIKNGPVIFFGNEFFDAIPIKQFLRKENLLLEKHYAIFKKREIKEIYKKASKIDVNQVKNFTSLKNLKFFEFPKLGFKELDKMITKVTKLKGGLIFIDYGYLGSINKSTLQSVRRHKKNNLLENLGKADITSLVNFDLLGEYLKKNSLKVKKVSSQKFFLERMGIIERANIISKKMSFRAQTNLYLRLKRLLDSKSMGSLFKVIFAYKNNNNSFQGFE